MAGAKEYSNPVQLQVKANTQTIAILDRTAIRARPR